MGLSLIPKATPCILFLFLLSCTYFTSTDAYDALDPNGNITIKWDIISWTPDGYVAVVTMNNFQQYRHIAAPGWSLGWTWAKKEVIWSMMGSQTTEQGDCSKFKSSPPHCCKKDPTVVDLLPGTPYNQQIANCCKGGVLTSWAQDSANAVASFQVSVGRAGTTNKTVKVPKNFTLKAPGPGYTCGPAKIVRPTQFMQADKRRVTQALTLVPFGEQWKKMKKIVMNDLLSTLKHQWLQDKRIEEAHNLMVYVYNKCKHVNNGGLLNVRTAAQHYCCNVIRKLTFNARYIGKEWKDGVPDFEEAEHLDAIFTLLKYIYKFGVSIYMPCLNALDLDGHENKVKKAMRIMKKYHNTIIKERIKQWNDGLKMDSEDFLGILITLKNTNNNPLLTVEEINPSAFFNQMSSIDKSYFLTWNVTCTYSQFLAQKTPTCCVSLSSFYNDTIVPCPTCACGCQSNSSQSGTCVNPDTPHLASVVAGKNNFAPLVQCTSHMCPVRIHWHVKLNYKEYWRVKVTITNFNYKMNYSEWNLVVQHPNFDNLTKTFSFNYKSLNPYGPINDTAMLWGVKFYNDFLNEAGPQGNVQSELLFRKDKSTFTFDKGWAFPRRIYFNGDNCVMPPPDAYPWLPNTGSRQEVSVLALVISSLVALVFYAYA